MAVLGAAGLALSLALQQSLGNFAGGLLILIMKPFRVGDYIISPSGEGRVSMVGLVYTTILTTDNKAITIEWHPFKLNRDQRDGDGQADAGAQGRYCL